MKRIALLCLFVGIVVLHAGYYLPFISDDALISLRYARRLLDGKGLTWNDGLRIEGYSNLLWILMVAFLGLFGADPINASRVLGILGMSAVMASILYWPAGRVPLKKDWFPLTVTLLFLSVSAPVAVWAVGGLEQPLWGALIAVSIPLMYSVLESDTGRKKRLLLLSLVFGALCITRPDGPIFTAAAVVTVFIAARQSGKRPVLASVLLITLFPFLLYGGQVLFRLLYYGELVPNTALVKLTPSWYHAFNGARYLGTGFMALFPFSVMALACLVIVLSTARTRKRGIHLVTVAALWSAYVILIGGDVFPAYRHGIPLLVVMAFALLDGVRIAADRLKARPAPGWYCAMIIIVYVLFIPFIYIQFTAAEYRRAIHERWEWSGKELGLLLKKAFGEQQPLLAVTAAGCLPYWSELPVLDMLGLNDYYLPRHPPDDVGDGFLGHELGDGRYVLDREPDLIVFNVGSGPAFRSGAELAAMPEFHARYCPVTVVTAPGSSAATVYVRKYSGKTGIRYSSSGVVVPGYLFGGDEAAVYLNEENRLVALLEAGRTLRCDFHCPSSLATRRIRVKASKADAVEAEVRQEDGAVSIELVSKTAGTVAIEEVVLRKQ